MDKSLHSLLKGSHSPVGWPELRDSKAASRFQEGRSGNCKPLRAVPLEPRPKARPGQAGSQGWGNSAHMLMKKHIALPRGWTQSGNPRCVQTTPNSRFIFLQDSLEATIIRTCHSLLTLLNCGIFSLAHVYSSRFFLQLISLNSHDPTRVNDLRKKENYISLSLSEFKDR